MKLSYLMAKQGEEPRRRNQQNQEWENERKKNGKKRKTETTHV